MKVSVIIPVYNAEKYVAQAVESALQQKECGEIILVEDGSPDNAIEVCKKLSDVHEKVKLYQHENGRNKGAGPSRNLGIIKSNFEYVAFLDADDIYLPDRFKNACEILSKNPDLDGVYEPVGCTFENEEAKKRYFTNHSSEIAMVKGNIKPEDLFEALISGKYGYIHLNGLVVRKKSLLDVGLFPELKLHQDMILIFQLSLLCKLAPGDAKTIVAKRLLHMCNRITNPENDILYSQYIAYRNFLGWVKKKEIIKNRKKMIQARCFQLYYRFLKSRKQILQATYLYLYFRLFLKRYEFWHNLKDD